MGRLHNVHALLRLLPKEARAAYRSGGTWNYEPESAEGADPTYVRGTDSFYMVYYVAGYLVEAGRLYETVWRCWDGDWDIIDQIDVADARFQKWHDEYFGWNTIRATHQEYYEEVARTGQDPLGEFIITSERRAKRVWRVYFSQAIGRVIILGARRRGRGPLLNPGRPAFPQELRAYLSAREIRRGYWEVDDPELRTLEALKREGKEVRWMGTRTPGRISGLVTITEGRRIDVAEALRKAARKAIREYRKQDPK